MSWSRKAISRLRPLMKWAFGKPAGNIRRPGARMQVEQLEVRDVPATLSVGMNLDWITDYAPAWMFKDAFQQSRAWLSQEYNTVTRQTNFQSTRPVQIDHNGWPVQLDTWLNEQGQRVEQRLVGMMYHGTNGAHPEGVYHARWQGDVTIAFYGDARVTSQGLTPEGEHFAELQVTPTNAGIFLRVDRMDAANPLHDLHVWMPDYNGESLVGESWRPGSDVSPFHPLFKERLAPFDTIRFMQPSDTVTSQVVHWSDSRPVPYAKQSTFATDFQNGMSPEYMIELANELDADPWFNMPHLAEDDYVRGFATLVRDTVEPGRTIYVEWSNELWNWAPGFYPHYWARAQAAAEGVSLEEVVARETRRDFAIWSEVFAGQEDRLVRVVGGWTAATSSYGFNNQVLSRMNGEFDALAVAPYIAPPQPVRDTYTSLTTVDQVIADTRATIAPTADMVRQNAAMVRQYEAQLGRDLQLISYEGGTHLDIRDTIYQRVFFEAAADPRMYDIVSDYLVAMADAGLESLNYYKFTDRRVPSLMNPDFGTLNRMDQPMETAHRYRALMDAIANPPIVSGPPAVVTLAVTDARASEAGNDTAQFTLTRADGRMDRPLTVRYLIGGTATNGTDYDQLTGSVTFAAGQSTATITVVPRDDSAIEPIETVMVLLQADPGFTLGTTTPATVQLVSDDIAVPTVGLIGGDTYAAEAGRDRATLWVGRFDAPLALPLTVYYQIGGTATNGIDYERLTGMVVIPAGQTNAMITVTPIDDAEIEPTETIILTLLDNPTYRSMAGRTSATANLVSDDVARPAAALMGPTSGSTTTSLDAYRLAAMALLMTDQNGGSTPGTL